ncbi:homocysteine S-methyltransferase family protein [Lautropia mirabilis]
MDIWLAETQSSVAEAAFWRTQLPQDGKPFWTSFTLEDTQPHEEPVLRSGERVADAVRTMVALGAEAVLFNCSMPEVMEAAVRVAYQALGNASNQVRLGVYANAFEASHGEMRAANDGLDEIRKDTTPTNYLAWARQWVDAGASMVGGCCGIGPGHIAELAAHLQPAAR